MSLPPPDSPLAPKYWKYETGGRLAPAVCRYIADEPLSADDIALIKAYCRQWVDSPVWDLNPALDDFSRGCLAGLRDSVKEIATRRDLSVWIARAVSFGVDPL